MRSIILVGLLTFVTIACVGSSPFRLGPRPAVAQIQPSSAAVGDEITISGSGFTATDNALRIGAGYILKLPSADTTTIRLTLPSYLGACAPGQEVCVALALPMAPGTYKLSVVNANGTSNQVSFQVIAK